MRIPLGTSYSCMGMNILFSKSPLNSFYLSVFNSGAIDLFVIILGSKDWVWNYSDCDGLVSVFI